MRRYRSPNSLAVRDLVRSVEFYRILFAQEPTKTRPGYAKFEVAEPPVNLSLNESSGKTAPTNSIAHFGIQVKAIDFCFLRDQLIQNFDSWGKIVTPELKAMPERFPLSAYVADTKESLKRIEAVLAGIDKEDMKDQVQLLQALQHGGILSADKNSTEGES